jgi:hypothetical protein
MALLGPGQSVIAMSVPRTVRSLGRGMVRRVKGGLPSTGLDGAPGSGHVGSRLTLRPTQEASPVHRRPGGSPRRRPMRPPEHVPADRLARLRALVARLEQLPASAQREWMLSEARARMVDVETGASPRAFRPQATEPEATDRPATEPPVRRARPAVPRNAPPPAAAPTAGATSGPPVDAGAHGQARTEGDAPPFGVDGLLSLDDSPADPSTPADADDGHPDDRPWRRGLRG